MDFFTAMAQEAAQQTAKQPSIFETLVIPMAVMLPVMYFLMIRPQQQKAKEAANLLAALKAGDEVVTTGGIIGRVKSVAEQFVTIEIATNTAIKVMKSHIAGLTKSTST